MSLILRATEAHALPLEFARRCIVTKINKDKKSTREDARERVQLGLVALALLNSIETIDEIKAAQAFGLSFSNKVRSQEYRRKCAREYLRDVCDSQFSPCFQQSILDKQEGKA